MNQSDSGEMQNQGRARRSVSPLAVEPIDPPRGARHLYRPEVAAAMPISSVYFVLAVDLRLVKIGYAKNPWARLSSMQVGSPSPLALFGIIETYLPCELESDLHAHFAAARAHGEWFRFQDEMYDYVMKWGRKAWDDDEQATA